MSEAPEYELLRPLGVGGMAEVWLARHAGLGRAEKHVAIKYVAAHFADNSLYTEQFLREARLSMLMSHSNVVQVFETGEVEGRGFIVMEWVDGLNLAEFCEAFRRIGKRVPPALAAFIFGEILQGLAYAHAFTVDGKRYSVVHRDLSPHNVMLSRWGEVKITDFGVARLGDEPTRSNKVKGKLRYMPPEQLRGDSGSPRVDLFAAGALLWELVECAHFRGDIPMAERSQAVLAGAVPQMLAGPPALQELYLQLVAREPEDRPPSAAVAAKRLFDWSGYRNCRLDVAKLASFIVGQREAERLRRVDAQTKVTARSVATKRVPMPDFEAATKVVAARPALAADETLAVPPEQLPEGALTLEQRTPALVVSGAVTRPWLRDELELPSRQPEPARAGASPAPRPRLPQPAAAPELGRSLKIGALVFATFVLGGLTMGALLRWTDEGGGEEHEARIEARAPAGGTAPGADQPEPTAPVAAQIEVELVAEEFEGPEVKIAGQVLRPDASLHLQLPPGNHRVYLREQPDDEWVRVGTARIRAGARYRITLTRDPLGLDTQEQAAP